MTDENKNETEVETQVETAVGSQKFEFGTDNTEMTLEEIIEMLSGAAGSCSKNTTTGRYNCSGFSDTSN